MTKLLTIALVAIAFFSGTVVTAWSATSDGPRYTLRERVKIRAHSCNEDEYLFIPAKRVNDHVIYDTPDHPLCVSIENVRRAD